MWPQQQPSPTKLPALNLIAANGSRIPNYGRVSHKINIGGSPYTFSFIHAKVSRPIIGLDFLLHFGLVIDCKNRVLIHSSGKRTPFLHASSRINGINLVRDSGNVFDNLLARFPEVTDAELATRTTAHGVQCHIPTSGPPIKTPPRRLTPEKLETAKKYFQMMCAAGICRRSSAAWSSGLHMVRKKDGTWRPCGDYRRLNAVTKRDNYPIPNLQDCLSRLSGNRIFSKIDLVKGYHQIPVARDDIPKTAVSTPFGLFEFVRMPFGLANAAQSFQRLMDVATEALPGVTVYLDDVLVSSRDAKEHLVHLRQLFSALSKFGLVVNRDKCEFGQSELEFLGHRVNASGIAPLPEKVEAVRSFPKPTSVKGLQRFLGMLNFYRRFVPNIAAVLRPLTDSLAGKPKEIVWTIQMERAFNEAKRALANATQLSHYVPGADLHLLTDASTKAIAGVVHQVVNGEKRPLAFFSRRTSQAESRYSTYDLELLALYSSILHFRTLLEGRTFRIFTDQKPLTRSFLKPKDPVSDRQRRQLAFISEFCTDLAHVPGVDNVTADALSRQFDDETDAPAIVNAIVHQLADVDLEALAREQDVDDEEAPSLVLRKVSFPGVATKIKCDVSTSRPRIFVPRAWRLRIFLAIHNLSHPSGRTTLALISRSYVWPRMSADVKSWARSCESCQRFKVARHTKAPVSPIPVPKNRFQHVHVDLVGPLPPRRGCQYLLTMIDRTTRWTEVAPLPDMKAETTTNAFISTWIARFGIPETVTSDRGAQFTSTTWKHSLSRLGINATTTTAYHPQSNGIIERYHRTLKNALRCVSNNGDWMQALPWVLLGIRNAPRDDSGISAAETLFGTPLRVPGLCFPGGAEAGDELLLARSNVQKFTPLALNTKKFRQTPFVPADLKTAKAVFVRDDTIGKGPLAPRYLGPFEVISRDWKNRTFRLSVGDSEDNVSIDRLKPATVL